MAVSDFEFSLKYFWRPQGPLIRVCGMSMDASFRCGELIRHWRPEIPLFSQGGGPIGLHLRHHNSASLYVAWLVGTTNIVVVPARQAGNRFL
jgi:hypothetical protein